MQGKHFNTAMEMLKKEVFELVRRERAALWAGAGLSLYAGYPSAQKLGKAILKSLTIENRSLFALNQNLDDLCEQYIKIAGNNRDELYKVLKRIFSKKTKSLQLHEKIAQIPHFKNIITTNYDTLFEQAYRNRISVIADIGELNRINKDQTQLFKIHGDLTHQKNIIISKSDYANFYDGTYENVYWTTVKERIINNNIVFIGYSLGDININTIINSISSQLKDNHKKHFLIAPNFPSYEIESLFQKGIFYIDSTAELFIDELLQNIKDNIVKDFHANDVSLDTFNAFLQSHDLSANFSITENNRSITRVISNHNTPGNGVISLHANNMLAEQLKNLVLGKTFNQLELPEKLISKFNVYLSGINFVDKTEIKSLIFVPHPIVETTFDIVFANGFDLRDIPVQLYTSRFKTKLVVTFRRKKIKLEFSNDNIADAQMSFDFASPYGNPKDELEAFKLMKYLVEGLSFTVYLKNGKNYLGGMLQDEQMFNHIEKYVAYFELLLTIEKGYNVRFNTIDELSEDNLSSMRLLQSGITQDEILYDFPGNLEAIIDNKETIQHLIESCNITTIPVILEFTYFSITLYEKKFSFKQRVFKVYDPEIVNTDEIENGSTKIVLGSRSNQASDILII